MGRSRAVSTMARHLLWNHAWAFPCPGWGAVGPEGTKVCAAPMFMSVGACTDPATAAKYGETCAVDGAFGAFVGGALGKNVAAAITGAALGCASGLAEKAARRSGEDSVADDIDAASKAWDAAEVLCFVTRKC